jgi:hypothetical protein
VVKQNLKGDHTKLDAVVTRIRQREQELEVQGNKDQKAKSRRFKQDESSSKSSNDKFEGKIPEIPSYVLFKVEPSNVRRDLMKWRAVWNKDQRIIRTDELNSGKERTWNQSDKSKDKNDRDDNSTGSNKDRNTYNGKKGKKSWQKNKKSRRTKVVRRRPPLRVALSKTPE